MTDQTKPTTTTTTTLWTTVQSNVQPRIGPARVTANSWRPVAEAAAERAKTTDDVKRCLSTSTYPRCCNCGLLADPSMRLPVRDAQDPVVPAATTKPDDRHDWIRIPLGVETAGKRRFTLSDYVACTPACGLRYMYDSTAFRPTHAVDIFHRMLRDRHYVDEPVNAAPPADALAYVNAWNRLNTANDSKKSADAAVSTAVVVPRPSTRGRARWTSKGGGRSSAGRSKDGTGLPVHRKWSEGLSVRSFYTLLAEYALVGYKQRPPLIIPPHEGEDSALQLYDHRFTQYYYADLLPAHTARDIQLPAGCDSRGVQLDTNPDSDAETDFATGVIHPPPPAPPSSIPSIPAVSASVVASSS
jgi:hypothetical protein